MLWVKHQRPPSPPVFSGGSGCRGTPRLRDPEMICQWYSLPPLFPRPLTTPPPAPTGLSACMCIHTHTLPLLPWSASLGSCFFSLHTPLSPLQPLVMGPQSHYPKPSFPSPRGVSGLADTGDWCGSSYTCLLCDLGQASPPST